MADDAVAFPTLTDADMAVMDKLGTRRPMAAGEYLYREGDPTYDFIVVVSGSVDMVVSGGDGEQIVAHHGAGRFLGELNMLSGLRVFVSARVAEDGRGDRDPARAAAPPHRHRSGARRHRPGRLHRPALGAHGRRVVHHPAHRLALLPPVPAGTRVPVPLPDPLRVAGPRQRPRRWRPCWSSSASTPTSCRSSSPRALSCAGPAPANWPSTWVSRSRACPGAASTWSSSAAVPPAWPPPSTAPRRGSTRWGSRSSGSAARRGRARALRTTSGSRWGSREAT